jgi:lysophospholipase L1-like esterase
MLRLDKDGGGNEFPIRKGWARPSFRRVQRLFLWIAVAVCAVVVADNLSLKAMTGVSIKNGDYVFLGLAGAFLILAAVRRDLGGRLAVSVVAVLFLLTLIEGGLDLWSLTQARRWPWYVWPPNYSCLMKPADPASTTQEMFSAVIRSTRTSAVFKPARLAGVSPEGRFSINSLGIRGPEFQATDRYRILCVGGSTTECIYLDDAKTWPAQLLQMLSEHEPGLWVGNVGRSATTAPQHVLLLQKLPEARQVDCWVALCGINDMHQQVNGTYAETTANAFGHVFAYRRPGAQFRRPLQRNLWTFMLAEAVCRRILVMLRGPQAGVYQDVGAVWVKEQQEKRKAGTKVAVEVDPQWLTEYQAQLTKMIELARCWGKRLIFMTQPTIWAQQMDEKTEALTLGGRLADGRYLDNATRVKAMGLFNQVMRDLTAREGIELVDLAAKLPKTTEVFYDDCHFNENGARLVAAALAEQVSTCELKAGKRKP